MTSKEGLEMLCDVCNTDVKCYQKNQCTIYKKIENDLEVLEIIKPRIKDMFIKSGYIFDNVIDDNYFHLTFGLTGKEYKKIKEWIENDK